ncbi:MULTISPECIES: hypothetical protein [Streptomyces]|uniref:hypothetical protein n=1 Tax=Streptomyces TaxID=1883 RepID=UPI000FFF289B|nr:MULTISPECIES: hypothetical protein [Streptomyces]
MRLRWRIPLPGPLSIGGGIPLTGGRRRRSAGGTGGFAALITLLWWCVLFELWVVWWALKPFYILAVLAHRRATGQPTPIRRSRNGWW